MSIENEITILEINKQNFINEIIKLGAKKITEELLQKRYTYDFKPINKNKWIRLRTNGIKTTLTIKEINNDSKIGAKELEIEVSSFEETNLILNNLGYYARNYQENKRQIFLLDDVEISIDTWPMIPTYVELEAKSINKIENLVNKLNIDKNKITELDVTSIYKKIYNIDILNKKVLKF